MEHKPTKKKLNEDFKPVTAFSIKANSKQYLKRKNNYQTFVIQAIIVLANLILIRKVSHNIAFKVLFELHDYTLKYLYRFAEIIIYKENEDVLLISLERTNFNCRRTLCQRKFTTINSVHLLTQPQSNRTGTSVSVE